MNTFCPSCSAAVDSAVQAECPTCGWPLQSPAQGRISIRPAGRPKIQVGVDVAITVDRTGSSAAFEKGIHASIPTILRQIERKARTVRTWLQSHGDEDEGQQPVLLTDGGSVADAINDVKAIFFGGGGDAPEHHLSAIENLLTNVPWPPDPLKSRGALLAFLTDDSKPATSGRSAAEIGAEIRRRGVLLYVVCQRTPELKALCDAAGGLMFEISNDPDPADLQQIASRLAASVVASIATGGTRPMSVPV